MDREYEDKPFPEYQRLLERFERFNDPILLPESHLIVRLDAHRFGSAWDNLPKHKDYPYTPEVQDWLLSTARGLMCIGMKVKFAFIHGDEISLAFDVCETINPRKVSRLVSNLSSAAAAFFTNLSTLPTFFDIRVLEIPQEHWVPDYFFWQRKVGWRNFYSKQLERRGLSPQEANQAVSANFSDMPFGVLDTFRMKPEHAPSNYLFGSGLWWQDSQIVQSGNLPQENQEYFDFLNSKLSSPASVLKVDFADIPWAWEDELVTKRSGQQRRKKPSRQKPRDRGLFRVA